MTAPGNPISSTETPLTLPSDGFSMTRNPLFLPGSVLLALLFLLLLPGAPSMEGAPGEGALGGGLAAQELRGSVSGAFSGWSQFSSSWGGGAGIRILPWNSVGFGVEVDRWNFTPTVNSPICDEAGNCVIEPVAMSNRLETVTFLLLAEALRTEEWRLRIGFGRVAGTARGSGVSQVSGAVVNPPKADRERSRLAWSRGADGSVVVFELLRALPLPGPLVPSLLASYRYHHLDMEGCVSGAFSPFCGETTLNEVQLGLHLPIWPR
jgi:hypothetical protein